MPKVMYLSCECTCKMPLHLTILRLERFFDNVISLSLEWIGYFLLTFSISAKTSSDKFRLIAIDISF